MTFDEILVEDKMEAVRRVDTARMRLEHEALAVRRGGLRRGMGGFFVRLGAWLDRGALDRVAMVTRQAH